MGRISEEQMKYTSRLAALKLPYEELDAIREDMEGLLECFDVLKNLNTEGVEPAVYVHSEDNVFREDTVKEESDHEGMLQNAPSAKDGAFMVLGVRK